MFIYIITFLVCILIDRLKGKEYSLIKKIFLVYLYAFFCFGYTTGTDWRYYESLYESGSDAILLGKDIEQGFYYFISFIREIIPDFWLFLGLVKCIYLFSLIKVIRLFTKEIFVVLGLLMNYQLLFMLIDNPLRFMCASIFLLLATPYLVKRKYYRFLIIASISILFHFTLAAPIVLCLLIIFKDKPLFRNRRNLIILYLIACLISLFPFLIIWFRGYLATIFPALSNKLLQGYLIESNEANFTVGSFIRLLLFILFIYKKDIFDRVPHGSFIFYMVFIYFTIDRALMSLPTGFRISIYFSLFLSIGLYYILKASKFQLKFIILIMIGISMVKNLYTSYQFIPYTNSIFHIILNDHQPYGYRDQLNKKEYRKRTGKYVEDKTFTF